MNSSSNKSITGKISGIVDWLTQKRWQADTPDALHAEIHHLKETLSNAPTRPTRAVRKFETVESVTEQQKIMDLAG